MLCGESRPRSKDDDDDDEKFLALPQLQYALSMFLNCGHFSASCACSLIKRFL